MEDFTVDFDLSDFFSTVGIEKKKKKQELESLISNSFNDFFLKPLEEQFVPPKTVVKNKKTQPNNKRKKVLEKPDIIEKSLGLLAEPTTTKVQNDPLTPIDKKISDLENQYRLFLSRIQQQLSTLGGGGEVNLAYMEVPITTVTSSSYSIKYDDYYIGVNYAGDVTITLPKSDREGKKFVVKDELGEASRGANRYITIIPTGSDLIDGRDRAILAFDYGSLTFIWKSNSWRVI